jgi:DNA repair protein RecO (recombination protein O)
MKEGEGILIEIREYSNSSAILKILTTEGKMGGFLKGGLKQKERLHQFSLISFTLNKRLEEHLGVLKLEIIKNFGVHFVKNRLKVLVFCILQEILTFLIEEGMPDEELYANTLTLLRTLEEQEESLEIIKGYLIFELKLLSSLGFGLDFKNCALTGSKDVFFISPITGRGASFEAAKEFKERLFIIPRIYGNLKAVEGAREDLLNAFEINSHFFRGIMKFEKVTSRKKLKALI